MTDELKPALQELLDAMTATYPPETAGMEAQDAWATRQTAAVTKAREALQTASQSPWLPIETAPKDPRRRILLHWRSGGSDWVCIGAWASSDDSPHLRSPTCPREGWTHDGATCIPRNQKDCIGWMPVPAAPKAKP